MSGETDFEGRKALVTGGSRGIGRAVCLELARRGADVAFIYRSRDVEAEATASEIRALDRRALALKADLAQAVAVGAVVDRAAAEFGKLDVLVPAAGAMVAWRETGAAAKAGLEAMIRVIAREEGRRGIRANAVAIGLTDTDMGRAAFAQWGPETSERIVRGIPLQRIGTPEEVARVVCYLAGPYGGYGTGKVLQVDGGQIIAA